MGKTIIFDADGVLFDSVKLMFDVTNQTLKELDIQEVSFDKFRSSYYPEDWNQTFRLYGVDEDRLDLYCEKYLSNECKSHHPKLLILKRLLSYLKTTKNFTLHILTAAPLELIEKRLEYYKIRNFFDEVISVKNGCKSCELIKLVEMSSSESYFLGDSLSDARAAFEARKQVNLIFFAVVQSKITFSFKRECHISTEKEFKELFEKIGGDNRFISNLSDLAKL